MKSSVEQINPVQYRIHVEVTGSEVDQAFSRVLKNIQKKAHIQGFRPGKAPLDMIRKFYSNHAFQEVREDLIRVHLMDALKDTTLRTVAAPVIDRVENLADGQPFIFSAVVDTMPEIKLEGYKGLEISVTQMEYHDALLDRELNNLRQRDGKASPFELKDGESLPQAQSGMIATIGHTVLKNGEKLPAFDVNEYPVLLGSGQLLQGLEDLILGLSVGESKSGKVTLPQDFNDPELAGQELDITVNLKDLKQFKMPELDEEFAKDHGYDSLESFKNHVREQIDSYLSSTNKGLLETALVNKLMEIAPIEAPPAIVDSFVDAMIQERFQNNPQLPKLLKNEETRKELRPAARNQVIKILLLLQIFNQEKLTVSSDEINAEVTRIISQFKLSPTERKNIRNIRSRVEQNVRENLMLGKALKWMEENSILNKQSKKA